MNNIPTEQNTARQLERLRAQRQLYATAKTIFGAQVLLGGPIAIGTTLLGQKYPQLKGHIALWGFLIALSDLAWLTPWQKRLRETAAKVQELFDCDVLSLPWKEIKAGRKPNPEKIKEQSEKYKSWAASMPAIINWYPREVGGLPLHIARLVCQRANCWWDSTQRRYYAVFVLGTASTIFIGFLYHALNHGITIADFVLEILMPLAPLLLLGIKQCTEHFEAARRLEKLKEHIEQLWHDALNGLGETETTNRTREIQNEIFENRKHSPPVFDTLYKWLQRDYEVQMNHGATAYIAEAMK